MVYIYRRGSIMPFSRHIEAATSDDDMMMLDLFQVDHDDKVILKSDDRLQDIRHDIEKYHYFKKHRRVFYLPFTTVEEYLEVLELASRCLSPLGSRLITYLAAAVSDFYIPRNMMAEHKIQSSETLKLELFQVPKMLGRLKTEWAPQAYVVSFKLETDHKLVIPKARQAISNYGVDLVVANELHTRRDKVYLVTNDDCKELLRGPGDSIIEVAIVKYIVRVHGQFMGTPHDEAFSFSPSSENIKNNDSAVSKGLFTNIIVVCSFVFAQLIIEFRRSK